MKKSVAVLVLAVLVFVACAVRIESRTTTGVVIYSQSDKTFGSGVAVGPRLILTARHVVDHNDLVVFLENGRTLGIAKVRKSAMVDAAVVVTSVDLPAFRVVSRESLEKGDEVFVVATMASRGAMNSVVHGRVANVDMEADYGEGPHVNLDFLDMTNGPGCSGSGVVHDGKVVGIAVGYWNQFCIVIPVENFVELLR